MRLAVISLMIVMLMTTAFAGSLIRMPKCYAGTSSDAAKKIHELIVERDAVSLYQMYQDGDVVIIEAGTPAYVEDVGMFSGIDRIHLQGNATSLYVDNHSVATAYGY